MTDSPRRLPLAPAGEGHAHDVLAAHAAAVASSLSFEEHHLPAAPAPEPAKAPGLAAGLAGLGAVVLLAIAYAPTFVWMWGRWEDAHGYYEHGPLIPLVSAFLVWRERKRLALAPDATGKRLGLALLVSGMLLHVASCVLENVHFVSGGSLLLVLGGAALLVGGTRFARALAFPIGFLAFAVPLPMLAVAGLSLELKLLSAKLAIGALSVAGVTAVREGSIIHLPAGDVTVEDVCSGMRSMIALLAMGVLIAGLERDVSGRRRWLLALLAVLSVPIAIVANAVRVAFLCVMVQTKGPAILDTWVHEGAGIAVFAVALGLLLGTKALLVRGSAPAAERAAPRASSAPRLAASLGLTAALLVPSAAATLAFDRAGTSQAAPVGPGIPLELGQWKATELPIEQYVRDVLETNDLISRRYVKDGRDPVFLYLAASHGDRKVAHPPEVCLSGNGFTIEDRHEVDLARGVRGVELVLVRGPEQELVVYFYATGDELGPSYYWLQLEGALERFWNPDVASALVRFSARVDGGSATRATALASVRDLANELIPALRRRLREKTP